MDRRPVLAVLGGSFNPPHVAHVLIPTYLLARELAAGVLVAPCFEHPLGKRLPPFETRLAWTRAAMAVHGHAVVVSDLERTLAQASGRPSYTLELLRAVADAHPAHRVRLVIGSDIVEREETARWHRWDLIEADFDPIVVPRSGHAPLGHAALPEISSSQVRDWLDHAHEADAEVARQGIASAVPAAVRRMLAGGAGVVHLVGHGNVAHHGARWLAERGFEVRDVGARALVRGEARVDAASGDGVWLLARDPDLPALARALAAQPLAPGVAVLHGAGAQVAARVLAPLAAVGVPVGTLHPICALRREREANDLARAAFGVEGDAEARALALRLVGEQPWLDLQDLDDDARVAYHAACALTANHLAVISETAAAVLVGQGHPRDVVDRALGQLLRSSLDNLLALGVPAGVTGPVARGDQATVARHLGALPADAADLYRVLSERLQSLLRG